MNQLTAFGHVLASLPCSKDHAAMLRMITVLCILPDRAVLVSQSLERGSTADQNQMSLGALDVIFILGSGMLGRIHSPVFVTRHESRDQCPKQYAL
jgi:hypothetical protein